MSRLAEPLERAQAGGPDPGPAELYRTRCRPGLGGVLELARLNLSFVRASGDELVYRDAEGREVAVLDAAGGFGANLFGHHHPELAAVLRRALDERRPFVAQGSCRSYAAQAAHSLNEILRPRFDRDYVVTWVSTGAEAVEAAIAHAVCERRDRLLRLRRRAIDQRVRLDRRAEGGRDRIDRWCEQVLARLDEALHAPPAFVCLEGSFHGRTWGAAQLSGGEAGGERSGAGVEVAFVAGDDPAALRRAAARFTLELPWLVVRNGGLETRIERDTSLCGLMFEPIRGEGGVWPASAELAAVAQELRSTHGVPLILDEIQTGMGRTGRFLYAEALGLTPDYLVLGKSLGGSLVKVAALAVVQSRSQDEFTLGHTSTFGEDDLGCAVALRCLELASEPGGVPARCRRQGARLFSGLAALRAAYPDVIADVRGAGLMIGVQLDLAGSANWPRALRLAQDNGALGVAVAGYLLHEHRVRVAPATASPNVIRIQPSAFISDAQIDALLAAFERMCQALHREDAYELLAFLVGKRAASPGSFRTPIPTTPPPAANRPPPALAPPRRKVAFLGHLIAPGDLPSWDPSLARFSERERVELLERLGAEVPLQPLEPITVRSVRGEEVEFHFIGLGVLSETISRAIRRGHLDWLRRGIERAVDIAAGAGCSVVGLGGYTSIATGNGTRLHTGRIHVTSGNSLTVGMGLRAIEEELGARGVPEGSVCAAVLGAAGNIGRAYAELLSRRVGRLLLVGRPGRQAELERLSAVLGGPAEVEIRTDLASLAQADLVVSATNTASPVVEPEHLKPGPVVVNDVATPGDVSPRVRNERPDVTVIQGGLVRLPHNEEMRIPALPLEPGLVFPCMAETLLLGLAGIDRSYSYGDLVPEQIEEITDLAAQHGFALARAKTEHSH